MEAVVCQEKELQRGHVGEIWGECAREAVVAQIQEDEGVHGVQGGGYGSTEAVGVKNKVCQGWDLMQGGRRYASF